LHGPESGITRCGDWRPGAVTVGRSLPAVSAAVLSISAEKSSDAPEGSARGARDDGEAGAERGVSDVTLSTGGLSSWFALQISKDRAIRSWK
jgi:hypothetical protein